ncbi:unnamed protein product [Rotaria sp. Silwood2]|nr:unnamed protein product [Rotaria sp. Silwood2]CAF4440092.1 unnamed protein product [Rotaria sp. Silwood2]CAF4547288.1 unnamed protein product [Rotaria sp. Silwood2]
MKSCIDKSQKDRLSSSLNGMTQLEQIIHNNFIKYSGNGDAKNCLLQTMNQFKQCQLSRLDQIQAIPYLLEDSTYLWYIENEQSIISFESFCKLFLQQFAYNTSSSSDNTSSLTSQLSVTMVREIIRTPTYYRGSNDDVQDWLGKLEQRFKMANWDDEHKLRYISLHLQDDAYKWWIQASEKITSWSSFVNGIKQAFGSIKMKELAFEQLRWYIQGVPKL